MVDHNCNLLSFAASRLVDADFNDTPTWLYVCLRQPLQPLSPIIEQQMYGPKLMAITRIFYILLLSVADYLDCSFMPAPSQPDQWL